MRNKYFLIIIVGLSVIGMMCRCTFLSAQSATLQQEKKIQIPESIQIEHDEIHATLVQATKEAGRVGIAAKELAQVLHPHFVREEEIALPPLGALKALAGGEKLTNESEILAMTDTLKQEMPRMLDEHKAIRAAVEKLSAAAREEQSAKYEQLAEDLALHAQTEEEVLYPAAVLVGDLIRSRRQ